MQTYQKKITVRPDDLDQLNHVNNVRYVKWVQDIAEEHWLKNASTVILNSFYWVLLKHTISYKSSAMLQETILNKTYVKETEGVTSTRMVEMYNAKTNKLIVTSETHWCLISAETKKPTRISDEIASLFN